MIHAQRLDATAYTEFDLWNNTMGHFVRRGSKCITLIDTRGNRDRLRYVFNVSDSHMSVATTYAFPKPQTMSKGAEKPALYNINKNNAQQSFRFIKSL